ncbi:hypothetical protein [Oceanobacillus timonensis]|uniref:hypothetical protein n=1 Tax=Oceanobacillus timonensis TaxID=1926285 RepID=UPI0015C4CF31|nr:hypothetical protein [Oceanobacillus timonensis]
MMHQSKGGNGKEFQIALDTISNKSKSMIVFYLMEDERLRFRVVQRAGKDIIV